MRFSHAALAIVTVLVFHAFGMLGWYEAWHFYDVPMHFAGGVAMAMLALALWDAGVQTVTMRVKKTWVKCGFFWLVVLGFVALVGIGWEWMEFVLDQLTAVRASLGLAQTSMLDTMSDLFFDLLGGGVVLCIRRRV